MALTLFQALNNQGALMAKKFEKKKYSHREWVELATKTFGDDSQEWAFVCPICGHVAKVKDWVAVGAPEGAIAFNCLGRYLENPRVAFGGIFNVTRNSFTQG